MQTGTVDWEITQQQSVAHARFGDIRYFIEVDNLSLKQKKDFPQKPLQTDQCLDPAWIRGAPFWYIPSLLDLRQKSSFFG
jgi:hypothetical protein